MKRIWPLLLFLLFAASVYAFWIAPLRNPPGPIEIRYASETKTSP